jgi:hypothetical protein
MMFTRFKTSVLFPMFLQVTVEFCFTPCRESLWRENQNDLPLQSAYERQATNKALTFIAYKEKDEIYQARHCDVLTD